MSRLLLLTAGILSLVLLASAPFQAADCSPEIDKDRAGIEESWWSGPTLDTCYTPPAVTPTPTQPPATPTPAPTATPQLLLGAWRYTQVTDALTGRKEHVAYLDSQQRVGYGDGTPIIFLRCVVGSPQQWELFIDWDEFIGGDEPLVSYRFGAGRVWGGRWEASTNDESTFLPVSQTTRFLQAISTFANQPSATMIVRVWRYDEQTITAWWEVTGAHVAIQRLTERCAR